MKNISAILCALAALFAASCSSNTNSKASKADEGVLVIAVSTDDGGAYFTDANGQMLFGQMYDRVGFFGDEALVAEADGKTYLMTSAGEIISIDPFECYGYWEYCGGRNARVVKNGKWGIVDAQGSVLAPCEYDHIANFSDGFAWVEKNNKCGYINMQGKLVVPCVYDVHEWEDGCEPDSFYKGHAIVSIYDRWGLVNKKGQLVVPCMYDSIGSYSDNAVEVKKNGKWGIINMKGEQLVPMIYDESNELPDGYLPKDKKYDYEEEDALRNKIRTKGGYDCVHWFSDGLACVEKNGKLGYVNKKGDLVIPCKYDPLEYVLCGDEELWCTNTSYYFHDGLVAVVINGRGTVINKEGDVVVPDCNVVYTTWDRIKR